MYAHHLILTKPIQERDKLVKKRQTDNAIIQDLPQTPGAEEFGKVSSRCVSLCIERTARSTSVASNHFSYLLTLRKSEDAEGSVADRRAQQ